MSEGTLGFVPKAKSQVYRHPVLDSLCLQVRTLQLSQTCMKGCQPRTDKLSCGCVLGMSDHACGMHGAQNS